MKHVGRMKNNGARVAIAYRTLPGDPYSALVIGTQGLGDSYHDTLMSLIESDAGQQTNELAEVLAVRRFPDGSVMLGYLHSNGHLKKVPTSNVLVTPDSQTQILLNELNVIIAKQKGVDLEDLAVSDGSPKKPKTTKKVQVEESTETTVESKTTTFEMTPAEMRSRADTLYKEAARLRKDADAMDPPKSKKKAVVEVE
jgi:hypothetical protein